MDESATIRGNKRQFMPDKYSIEWTFVADVANT